MSSEIVTRQRSAANKNKNKKEITGNIPSPARVPVREIASPGRPARPAEELIHVQKDAQLQNGDYWKLAVFGIVSIIVLCSFTTLLFNASEKNSTSSTQSNLQTSDWLTRLKNFDFFSSDEPTYDLYEKPIDEDASSVDVQLEASYLDILWSYYPFGGPSDEHPSPTPAETDQEEDTNTSKESEPDNDSREDNSKESLNDDELENYKDDETDGESEENLEDDEKKSEDDDSDEKDDENDVSKSTDDSQNTYKPYKSHGFYSYKKHETEDDEDDGKDEEDKDDVSDESKEQVDRRDQRFNYYHNRESEEERSKYEYIEGEGEGEDDLNESSEQGAREKFDSGEDTNDEDEQDVKNDEKDEQDVKDDENQSHSSEEVEQKIGRVIEEKEPGNTAEDVNLEEAQGLRAMQEARRKSDELVAAAKAANKTVKEYLKTIRSSSDEQSENDSGDEQTAESNIPVDSEKSQTASETGSELEDDDVDYAPYGSNNYTRLNITNREDWPHRHLLDSADDDWNRNENFINASRKYVAVLRESPRSVRAKFGMAIMKDRFTSKARSNDMLKGLIRDYKEILNSYDVPEAIEKKVVKNLIPRMRFSGDYKDCVPILRKMVVKYPDEIPYQIDLAVSYLILNKLPEAESILERVLEIEPDNGLALVNYGFIMKMKGNLEKAVETLSKGISSRVKGTEDSKFYYHLGEALQRLGHSKEAQELYQKAADRSVFRSKYQRSLYNVRGLKAKPWWALNETKYESFFKSLESNWQKIRDEVQSVIKAEKYNTFQDEAEQLRETGEWKQLELFSRGVEKPECKKFPITCDLIRGFAPAAKCKRGQVKFSIMQPGTHVWPHCGPTNCRLRAHLGLIVPDNVTIRVADETRRWKEGEVLVFDDSFEHEIWHNGTSSRLILIVDVWHPNVPDDMRKHLPPI